MQAVDFFYGGQKRPNAEASEGLGIRTLALLSPSQMVDLFPQQASLSHNSCRKCDFLHEIRTKLVIFAQNSSVPFFIHFYLQCI